MVMTSTQCRVCAQLGWQAGDEGSLLLAEAQGTPKVIHKLD